MSTKKHNAASSWKTDVALAVAGIVLFAGGVLAPVPPTARVVLIVAGMLALALAGAYF